MDYTRTGSCRSYPIDEATLRDLLEPVGDLDDLDQACFHKSEDRWRQVREESWDHVFERTLVYLRTTLGYFFDFNISEGDFGRLVRMYDPDSRAEVTVWLSSVVNARRENLWRTLSHPHLMELVRRIRVDILTPCVETCVAYVMPAFQSTLQQKVDQKAFLSTENSYAKIKEWLRQITDALVYLHQRDLYHLDVNPRNVFILSGGQAVLGGLASLTPSRIITSNDVKLDTIYCPPDVIAERLGLTKVPTEMHSDGIDVWSMCILIAEVLTSHWRWKVRKFLVLTKNRDHTTHERLTLLGDYMTSRFQNASCLKRYLLKNFKGVTFEDDEIIALAALLAYGLQVDPNDRETVSTLLGAKYWSVSCVSSKSALQLKDEDESSLDNTTNYTWDDDAPSSSREFSYYDRNTTCEEDDTDEELRHTAFLYDTLVPFGRGPPQIPMILLPHADASTLTALEDPLERYEDAASVASVPSPPTNSLADKTKQWINRFLKRLPQPK